MVHQVAAQFIAEAGQEPTDLGMAAAKGSGEQADAHEVLGRHRLERYAGEQTALRHAGVGSDLANSAAVDDQEQRPPGLAGHPTGGLVVAIPESVAGVVGPAPLKLGRDVPHDLSLVELIRPAEVSPEEKECAGNKAQPG